jgi:uncharacterized membrane protein YkoI
MGRDPRIRDTRSAHDDAAIYRPFIVFGSMSAPAQRPEANRMIRSKIAVLTLIAVFGLGTATMHAAETKKKEDQAALQKEAKISMKKAREIALKKAPGTVKSSELEREKGKLIYSFDIQTTSKTEITEVNVDAMDGKIVSVEHENAKKEAEEKKAEAKEEKKH